VSVDYLANSPLGSLRMDDERPDDIVLTVQLTDADVECGQPGDCKTCPWALAVIRAACAAGLDDKGQLQVKVFGDTAMLKLADERWYVALCPFAIREFVRRFDHAGAIPAERPTVELRFHLVREEVPF